MGPTQACWTGHARLGDCNISSACLTGLFTLSPMLRFVGFSLFTLQRAGDEVKTPLKVSSKQILIYDSFQFPEVLKASKLTEDGGSMVLWAKERETPCRNDYGWQKTPRFLRVPSRSL